MVHSNRFTLIFLMNTQLLHIVYNNSYNVTNCFSRIWFQNVLSNRFTLIFFNEHTISACCVWYNRPIIPGFFGDLVWERPFKSFLLWSLLFGLEVAHIRCDRHRSVLYLKIPMHCLVQPLFVAVDIMCDWLVLTRSVYFRLYLAFHNIFWLNINWPLYVQN